MQAFRVALAGTARIAATLSGAPRAEMLALSARPSRKLAYGSPMPPPPMFSALEVRKSRLGCAECVKGRRRHVLIKSWVVSPFPANFVGMVTANQRSAQNRRRLVIYIGGELAHPQTVLRDHASAAR